MPGEQNDRLLNDEEIKEALRETYGFGVQIERGHFGVRKAQDAKTSKCLVEKFNQWADERILDLNRPQSARDIRLRCEAGIDALNWAKQNLERLAREVLAE